jgi:chromosomal replication initiator protein
VNQIDMLVFSLIGVALLIGLARLLGFARRGGLVDAGLAERLAVDALPGFRPCDVAVSRDGAGALVAGRDGRVALVRPLGDRFVVRPLAHPLVARAGENVRALNLDEAQSILRPHLRGAEKRVTVDDIQKAVAEHYSLRQADLLSERRNRAIARPRQAAMWLAKQLTTRSLPDIGRRFGGRDHTTVIHAVRRIEELKAADPVLTQDLETLTRKLRG